MFDKKCKEVYIYNKVKSMKKGPSNLSVILIILLIISIIFKDKYIYLAPSLSVSISSFIYAFTFLIPILIMNWTKFKDAKNIIRISTKAILLFIVITTILCTITGNLDSIDVDNSLRNIFTPNNLVISNFNIYYPDLNFLGIILIYFFSHNILISIYETLINYTNIYLSYSIAVFISFIIDTMFMIPVIHIKDIYYTNMNMLEIVKYLTGGFMVVIFTSLIMTVIFAFYTNAKQKKS